LPLLRKLRRLCALLVFPLHQVRCLDNLHLPPLQLLPPPLRMRRQLQQRELRHQLHKCRLLLKLKRMLLRWQQQKRAPRWLEQCLQLPWRRLPLLERCLLLPPLGLLQLVPGLV